MCCGGDGDDGGGGNGGGPWTHTWLYLFLIYWKLKEVDHDTGNLELNYVSPARVDGAYTT